MYLAKQRDYIKMQKIEGELSEGKEEANKSDARDGLLQDPPKISYRHSNSPYHLSLLIFTLL